MSSNYVPRHAGDVPDVSPVEPGYVPRHCAGRPTIVQRLGAAALDLDELMGCLRVPSHVRELWRLS